MAVRGRSHFSMSHPAVVAVSQAARLDIFRQQVEGDGDGDGDGDGEGLPPG
jgi:hypothetical protein